jgi:hypothetical protein
MRLLRLRLRLLLRLRLRLCLLLRLRLRLLVAVAGWLKNWTVDGSARAEKASEQTNKQKRFFFREMPGACAHG